MKTKKLLSLLVLLTLMFCVSVGVNAAEEVASGTCGENLTWVLDSDNVLTISGTGEMTNFSNYSSIPWNDHKGNITKLVIEDGVTSIFNNAFVGYYNLTDITLPNHYMNIGFDTFRNSGFTKIQIIGKTMFFILESI